LPGSSTCGTHRGYREEGGRGSDRGGSGRGRIGAELRGVVAPTGGGTEPTVALRGRGGGFPPRRARQHGLLATRGAPSGSGRTLGRDRHRDVRPTRVAVREPGHRTHESGFGDGGIRLGR